MASGIPKGELFVRAGLVYIDHREHKKQAIPQKKKFSSQPNMESPYNTNLRELYRQYESTQFIEFRKRGKNDLQKPGDRAMQYAADNGNLPVFGKHVAERNFHYVVAGWHRFFEIFVNLPGEQRVFNEIIKEGEPFNFYIDLDLQRSQNINPEIQPGSQKEAEILEKVRVEARAAIVRVFPQVKPEDIRIVELDSSDLKKLSRHMIFRIPGKALKNWQTAAAIFDEILSQNNDPNNIFWVVDEKYPDKKKYFIDRSVYTKNRQFRLYQSHKFGNFRYFHFPGFDKPGDKPDAAKFWDSLVSYFPPEDKARLTLLEAPGAADGEVKRRALRPSGGPRKPKMQKTTKNGQLSTGNWLTDELSNMFTDEVYKVQMEEEDGISWFWVKSHDCQIAGPHHSNHIKYLVDFNTRQFTQKCTSEKCRGQSGPVETIPSSYWPSIERYFKEQDEFDYEETLNYEMMEE